MKTVKTKAEVGTRSAEQETRNRDVDTSLPRSAFRVPHSALVYVVDDDPSVRKGISHLLRAAGYAVEVFSSAAEFLARPCSDLPHSESPRSTLPAPRSSAACLVLDVQMPGLNGLQLQEALGRDEDNMPIVFITGHGDIPMSVRAMKQGAVEFLTKPVDRRDLLTAITVALRKNQEMRQQRADTADIRKCEQTLTPRERDVMERVIAGVLNKQIAAEFGIEEGTVKVHRGRVMAKMGVKSVAELVGLCAKWKAKVGEERIAPGKGAHHSPASIAGTQVPKDSTSLPEREPHPRPSAFRTSALRVPLCHQGAIAESGPIAYPPTQQQQQEA